MTEMRFEGFGGAVRIVLESEPLAMMGSHRQLSSWSVERGGLLFATSVGSTDGLVTIAVVSPPHPADRANTPSTSNLRYIVSLIPQRR